MYINTTIMALSAAHPPLLMSRKTHVGWEGGALATHTGWEGVTHARGARAGGGFIDI